MRRIAGGIRDMGGREMKRVKRCKGGRESLMREMASEIRDMGNRESNN